MFLIILVSNIFWGMIKMYHLELVRAPQHPRAAKTMMATPVPSKEREARESWKRSTERINLIVVTISISISMISMM